jgi:hypothetical protein
MGILNNGIFGGFSNKTGPLVGRKVKGRNVITGLHHYPKGPVDEKVRLSQQKLVLMNGFLGQISLVIANGFKEYAQKSTTINAAYKHNYPNAFVQTPEGLVLDYSKLVYSRGKVSTPCAPKVTAVAGGLQFAWQNAVQNEFNLYMDRASVVVYNADKRIAVIKENVALRKDLGYVFELPNDFTGDELHCYMSFNSANGKVVGDSVWCGEIVV